MDLSQLPKLGKVAGVPGITLGVVALVLGAVLEKADILPEAWRGPVLALMALGALLLGGGAIIAWVGHDRAGAQIARTEADGSAAGNTDNSRGKPGGRQEASTKGKNAPATNVRG